MCNLKPLRLTRTAGVSPLTVCSGNGSLSGSLSSLGYTWKKLMQSEQGVMATREETASFIDWRHVPD